MSDLRPLLHSVADLITDYREDLSSRRVGPAASRAELLEHIRAELPEGPTAAEDVIAELVRGAEPGLMGSAGPRYFGFVLGGSIDADVLGDVLASRPQQPAIVCAQAGNVNTGAFDELDRIGRVTRAAGAWLHVDGAFGLWAAANPRTRHLVDGIELADSWGVDGHKWLNVPYDSGYVFCAHPDVHATAMAYTAEYLTGQTGDRVFGGGDFVPESSRRARGFATWAAIRSLGRSGIAELVERNCRLARRFAAGLDAIDGVEVMNEVVLNQILVRVGDAETTLQMQQRLEQDGTLWCGTTSWRDQRLLRISVSGWTTTDDDVDRCIAAIASAREQTIQN